MNYRKYLYYLRQANLVITWGSVIFCWWIALETRLPQWLGALPSLFNMAGDILLQTLRASLYYAMAAAIGAALYYLPCRYIFRRVKLGMLEHWDPEQSILYQRYRDPQKACLAARLLCMALALLLLWPIMADRLSPWLTLITTALTGVLFIEAARLFILIFRAPATRRYHPRTGEFFEFYMETVFAWGENAEEKYRQISLENPDFPVAKSIYERHHKRPHKAPFAFDSIAAMDPRIQRGPLTAEQQKRQLQAHEDTVNHEVRMG